MHDGSRDTIFQGRAVHTLVEALHLEAPIAEASTAEDPTPVDLTTRMVQKSTMALDCWFPATQSARVQAATCPTPQQITRSTAHQWRK